MNLKEVLKTLIVRFHHNKIDFALSDRYLIDGPDIQKLLLLHQDKMDMNLVREYFRIFDKEALLDEWISDTK